MATGWETVGKCNVDSGLVLLIDPYYVVPPHLWRSFLNRFRKDAVENVADINYGIVIHTFHGHDGVYPVEARYNDSGQIIEVRIKFD